MLKTQIIRTVISAGLCAAIGFSALSIAGQAPAAYAATSASAKADKIIATGKKYLGVRYVFGAPSGSTKSFDCSSFTQYIYKQIGVSLPRSSKSQATEGISVKKANLKKGDLVFFTVPSRGKSIGHVAVYTGNNKILHTYGKGGVTFSNLNAPTWKKNYVTARRVIS